MDRDTNAVVDETTQGGLRRRLGRGLSALLGGGSDDSQQFAETAADASHADEIRIDAIDRNPYQPRKEFAEDALVELCESIKLHGLLQPLLVRPCSGRFQLIAGERRWLAAKRAGLQTVPCRIMELEDRQVYEVAIEENVKRKDLGVLEKAEAFRGYLERFGCSIEDLAGRLSMNRATVSNYLRLLDLSEPVKKALAAEKITNGHARALLSLGEEDQVALCKRIIGDSLSVRKTEESVKEIQQIREGIVPIKGHPHDGNHRQPGEAPQGLNSHLQSVQDQLREMLGAKVTIQLRGKDAGKIVIPFDSNDEFEGVLQRLRRAAA